MTLHKTKVIVVGATWQAVCSACGPIGIEQEYKGDAMAIARRHTEVGGFERSTLGNPQGSA